MKFLKNLQTMLCLCMTFRYRPKTVIISPKMKEKL